MHCPIHYTAPLTHIPISSYKLLLQQIHPIHPIRQSFNQSICQPFISSTYFKYIRYIQYLFQIRPIHTIPISNTSNTSIRYIRYRQYSHPFYQGYQCPHYYNDTKRHETKKQIIVYIAGVVYYYYTTYCTQLSYTENQKTFDMPL